MAQGVAAARELRVLRRVGCAVPRADRLRDRGRLGRRKGTGARPHARCARYGTPVPGYQAPLDTIDPAAEVGVVLLQAIADAAEAGLVVDYEGPEPDPALRADAERLAATVGFAGDPLVLIWGLETWSSLFGAISFELFGHFQNVVTDRRANLELMMRRHAARILR